MENINKLPNNRDDLAKRYGISKRTLHRWFIRADIQKEIPDIHRISIFNINQSKIIVNKFG